MSAVAVILVLVAYFPLTALGVWSLVTGRRFSIGSSVAIPQWPFREGWPIRILGLVDVVVAGFICVYVVLTGTRWETVIALYLFGGLAAAGLIRRTRKANAGPGSVTAPR